MKEEDSTKIVLFYAVIIVISFFPYISLLNADFVYWDDDVYIVENERVKKGLTLENVKWAFSTTYFGFYYPLTWISHMFDCSLYCLNPKMHHLTNIVWHILNTILVFTFFKIATNENFKSFVLASLFAVHPLNVESVAWISERKNLLAAFFFISGLNLYLFYLKSKSKTRYALIFISYLLGMIAKPILVTFPFSLLLLDFWPLKRIKYEKNFYIKNKSIIFEKIWFLILAPLFIYLTIIAQKEADALATLEKIPLQDRMAGAIIALKDYIFNFLFPVNLTALYPHLKNNYSIFSVVISTVLLGAFLFICLKLQKKEPVYLFGFLWFIVNLSPVLGIIQVGEQARADRYMYIAMLGLLSLVVFVVTKEKILNVNKKVVFGFYLLILIALSLKTHYQCLTWKNTETLFTHMIKISPNASQAYHNIAIILKKRGDIDGAIEYYKKAILIDPCKSKSLNNLGSCYAEKGDYENAIKCFKKAIECNPNLSQGYYNLGIISELSGKTDEAINYFKKTIELEPDKWTAYDNLGRCFIKKGDFNMAIDHFKKACDLMPNNEQLLYNYGYALEQSGDLEKAKNIYKEVLKISANHPAARKQLIKILKKDREQGRTETN